MRFAVKLTLIPLLLTLSITFVIDASYAADENELKMGFVYLQKALSQSLSGKIATERLQQERELLVREMQEKEEELKTMQEELAQQVSVLKEDSLKERQENFRKKMTEYERFRNDSAQDWERKKKELEDKILSELIKVIQELGKKKGYSIIFAREQGILYASDAIDMTDEAITEYDASQE